MSKSASNVPGTAGLERFSDYVERCLYDPAVGFYGAGRGRAGGRRGDFITSPEVGPLFGAVVARAVDRWWAEADRPNPFPVVDLGAGPGGLVRAMEVAAPTCADAWSLHGSDRAGRAEMPDITDGVVIANELLDNVPFDVGVRRAGGDAVLFVRNGASDRPEPVWQPRGQPFDLDVPLDRPFPILDRAAALIQRLLHDRPLRIVAFDYGVAATSVLAERGGWLRTYRQHERGDDPFLDPGAWDITTDLAVDQLPSPTIVSSQADFLRRHGLEELVEQGRLHWAERASAPDLTAMRMRSRVREAEALTAPDGLGAFLCLEWMADDPATGAG